jgi:hypothetical protein
MKKCILMLVCSIFLSMSYATAETTTETDSLTNTTIVNHYHKTRVVSKIVRDTVYLTPVEEYVRIAAEHQASLDSMSAEFARMDENFRDVQKESGYIKTFGIILLVLVLLLIAGIAFLACKLLRILKPVPSVDEPVQPAAERQPESELEAPVEPVVPVEPVSPVVPKPSLQAYNNSVHRFMTLNDNIASLRKKDNKPLIQAMYCYLSGRNEDVSGLMAQIRNSDMPEEFMEQFVSLVSEISSFLSHDKSVIDAWLAHSSEEGIADYMEAVRMPEGLAFNPDMDGDVFGDDNTGMTVKHVLKLGYYFPGNTIKPYREKSTVSC